MRGSEGQNPKTGSDLHGQTKASKSGAAIDSNCGYYLRRKRGLIRRHLESVSLNADNTALWQLRIDFELPAGKEASFEDPNGDDKIFLFPLVFLKKNEARINFSVHEENRGAVPIPTRAECDDISTMAIKQAIKQLGERSPPIHGTLTPEELEQLQGIPAAKPLKASIAHQGFKRAVGLVPSEKDKPDPYHLELGERIEASGLPSTLQLLVEHSLLWVTLRGRPSERRSIVVSQEITINRRALVRWSFGTLPAPNSFLKNLWQRSPLRKPWERFRRAWIWKGLWPKRPPQPVIKIGKQHVREYGRRDRRISFSAIGERIGQPLAWMPFEFELPTIYAQRCRSYHFEVRAPPGRSPRDLRMSYGPILAEPPEHESPVELTLKEARKTLTTKVARLDLPRKALGNVARFRVTIGVGDGAFPVLWFLAAAITAAMLWIFAEWHPKFEESEAQIAAGILLIVPALIAGLAVGSNDVPISQLIGGARMLLLVTGLSAAIAASALAGATPFHMRPAWTWTACAMAATAAAVPLATSWLLSSPAVWERLMQLNNQSRQEAVLVGGFLSALAFSGALIWINHGLIARIGISLLLLVLTVAMTVMANNRAAMAMGESRRYIAISFLLTGMACLILACIELSAVVRGDPSRLQEWAERGAWGMLLLAMVAGDILSALTSLAKPRPDEVHISPREGRVLLNEESVRVLPILFAREQWTGVRKSPAEG
jgi:hypothetical protein